MSSPSSFFLDPALVSRVAPHSTDSELLFIGQTHPENYRKTGVAVWRIRAIRQIAGHPQNCYPEKNGVPVWDFSLVWDERELLVIPS